MKRAYIYARTSTSAQQKEDRQSIDSQIAQAKDFLKGYPEYELQETIIDAASAFSGSHLEAGLGDFLKQAETGAYPYRDDLLIVVYTDRLTRLPIDDAFALLKRLAVAKVSLAITSLGAFIHHSAPLEFGLRMTLTSLFHLAHTDSKLKSDRVKKAFEKRAEKIREGANIIKRSGIPSWVSINDDGDYYIEGAKAETIKFIFEQKVKGLGGHRIAKSLAEKNAPLFTSLPYWTRSYVDKILRSPSVYGAYQVTTVVNGVDKDGKKTREVKPVGEPVENYFPAAISKDLYYAARHAITLTPKGRISTENPFRGLLKCHHCGANMHIATSGNTRIYLRCNSHKEPLDKTCNANGVRLELVKKRILQVIGKITLPTLEGSKPDSQAIKGRIQQLEKAINRNHKLMDFADDDKIADGAMKNIATYTKELQELEKELYRVEVTTPDLSAYDADTNPQEFNQAMLEVFEYITVDKRYMSFKLRGFYGNDWDPALIDWDAGESEETLSDYLEFVQMISVHKG